METNVEQSKTSLLPLLKVNLELKKEILTHLSSLKGSKKGYQQFNKELIEQSEEPQSSCPKSMIFRQP